MKASKEFKVGKHSIGYISSAITDLAKDHKDLESVQVPKYHTLTRRMTDAEIETDLKPGLSSLDELLAFLDNAPKECKDGKWNLFYFPSVVVSVYWNRGTGKWRVLAWSRGDDYWREGGRVFSPATDRPSEFSPSSTGTLTLESLDLRLKAIEKIINPDLLK